MALHRQRHLLWRNAAAIVGHSDQVAPARDDLHMDGSRAGIHRVFNQLLHYRCRPLHDFTGGDLTNHLWSQYLNAHDKPSRQLGHQSSVISRCCRSCSLVSACRGVIDVMSSSRISSSSPAQSLCSIFSPLGAIGETVCAGLSSSLSICRALRMTGAGTVSYTHLRAHET